MTTKTKTTKRAPAKTPTPPTPPSLTEAREVVLALGAAAGPIEGMPTVSVGPDALEETATGVEVTREVIFEGVSIGLVGADRVLALVDGTEAGAMDIPTVKVGGGAGVRFGPRGLRF